MRQPISLHSLLGLLALAILPSLTLAVSPVETPVFIERVKSGELPSVDERLPIQPSVVEMATT